MVKVIKASGEYEEFSEEKVRSSLQRAGVDQETQDMIVQRLKEKLFKGITTKELYSLVFGWLKNKELHLASRYNLKRAIMDLGPSGYPFEKFVSGILSQNDYQTVINQEIQGKCISHEVDVIALKDEKLAMIECKFHSRAGTKTNVKKALYTYARFLDVRESGIIVFGKKRNFAEAWLTTNTKLTSRAITYCQCMQMKAIGWNYPENFSLRSLVEKSNLHPLTCLVSLSHQEKQQFLGQGIVFCRDLVENEKTNFLLSKNKIKEIKQEARSVSRL